MEKWFKKVAIVTGASEGIGKDIALKLVEHGLVVIGCGRNLDKLEKLKACIPKSSKGQFVPFKCDVSNEEEVVAMFNYVKTNFKTLHVCINNAGVAGNGPILEGKTEEWKKMQDLNILGLCMCTRESFSLMKENEKDKGNEIAGHIINISSMLGHAVLNYPTLHFYSATKFAVKAISEGTRQELRNINSSIKLTQISPGAVDTGFHVNAGIPKVTNVPMLVSSDVTDAVMYALSTPAHTTIKDIHVLANTN